MKAILATTAALAMVISAGAASAATQSVAVSGTVARQCGLGDQSGSSSTDPTGYTPSVTFTDPLTNGNGTLNSNASVTIGFGNIWCNGPSNLTLSATKFHTGSANTDPGSFTADLDLIVEGNATGDGATAANFVNWYMGGHAARSGTDATNSLGGAFESGTGQGQRARVRLALPANVTQPNANGTPGDRPLAGSYSGTITLVVTPA